MYNNDDLYGISIGEYCDVHSISVDDLVASVTKDIEILDNRLKEIGDMMEPLFDAVYLLKDKKIRHRERLLDWLSNV